MGFATVEGRNIHYQFPAQAEARVRQGHNVLMVHGAFDNHRVWMHQYAYLERDYTPLAIDLPGHGESQGPAIDDPARLREFIKAFVGVMDLAPFVFAGHSMGGSMALDYAIHHPEDVEGLILVGAGVEWEMPARDLELWKTDPDSAHSANIGLLVSKKTPRRIVDDYAKAACGPERRCLYSGLSELQQVRSRRPNWRDPDSGPRSVRRRGNVDRGFAADPRQCKMNTTFEMIPAAGHAVMIEQPALLNEAIGAYLASLS